MKVPGEKIISEDAGLVAVTVPGWGQGCHSPDVVQFRRVQEGISVLGKARIRRSTPSQSVSEVSLTLQPLKQLQ